MTGSGVEGLAILFVPVGDDFPDFLGCFGEVEKFDVFRIDGSFGGEKIDVENPPPILLANENYRHGLNFARLNQAKRLKEFVESAISPGKSNHRLGPKVKMHFAHSEVAELETKLRGYVGIRILFLGKRNVQAYGFSPDIVSPPVGGLHKPWPAAGNDDEATTPRPLPSFTHASFLIPGPLLLLCIRA